MTEVSTGEANDVLTEGRSPLPPADYIGETKRLYDSLGYDSYRWAERPEPPAWVPIDKPLSECTVTLIGSGGLYQHGQIAFHTSDDTSIRVIDTDTPTDELRTAHFAYDQADARTDPTVSSPSTGCASWSPTASSVAHRESYAFMGGIYSTRRLEAETAPLLSNGAWPRNPTWFCSCRFDRSATSRSV